MNFQEVQGAVDQAWEFAWPPVVLLLIMILTFCWIAPTAAFRTRIILERLVTVERIRKTRASLRLWGLGKLLPIMAAFGIIFVLYFVNRIVHSIGDLLPPKVAYRADLLVARYGDHRMLGCIASRYSYRENGHRRFPSGVLARVSEDIIGENFEGAQPWEKQESRSFLVWNVTKFLFFWVILCFASQKLARGPVRWHTLFIPLLVLALVASGSLVKFVYALQQRSSVQIHAAEARYLTSKECKTYVLTAEDREALGFYRERSSVPRWWWLSMDSAFTRFPWIYEEVIRGGA